MPAKKKPEAKKETTKEERIVNDYQRGVAIVDIARIHDVEVDEVYNLIGMPEMMSVQLVGDLIDDAGPGAVVNGPRVQSVRYTKN